MKSFGSLVKQKRQDIGLTQAELARRVGCATSMLDVLALKILLQIMG